MRKIGSISVDPKNPPILFGIPNIDIDLANEFLKNEVGNNQNEINIVFASSRQPARVGFYKMVKQLFETAKKQPLFDKDQKESFEEVKADFNTRYLLLLASDPRVETGYFNLKTNIVTIFLDDFYFTSKGESKLNSLLSANLKHELSHSSRSFYEHLFGNVFYYLRYFRHLLFYVTVCVFLWFLNIYSNSLLVDFLSIFLSIFFVYKIFTWEIKYEDYFNDPEEVRARKSASTGSDILRIDEDDLETSDLLNKLFHFDKFELKAILDA